MEVGSGGGMGAVRLKSEGIRKGFCAHIILIYEARSNQSNTGGLTVTSIRASSTPLLFQLQH